MRLPAGVRDWLPHELARKREIEQQMRAVFGRWAYEEVQTPIVERFDVLERGLGEEASELLFQFNDRRSTALALRPEMTTPVARLVSTRMREAPLPLRLAYIAPVFRYYEQPQEGRMRELTQAGVELIGAAGIDADAETLFMAIEALDEIGLRDARFDINDARVAQPDLVERFDRHEQRLRVGVDPRRADQLDAGLGQLTHPPFLRLLVVAEDRRDVRQPQWQRRLAHPGRDQPRDRRRHLGPQRQRGRTAVVELEQQLARLFTEPALQHVEPLDDRGLHFLVCPAPEDRAHLLLDLALARQLVRQPVTNAGWKPHARAAMLRRAFADVRRAADRDEPFADAAVRRNAPLHDRAVDVQHERSRSGPLRDQRRDVVDVLARGDGDVPAFRRRRDAPRARAAVERLYVVHRDVHVERGLFAGRRAATLAQAQPPGHDDDVVFDEARLQLRVLLREDDALDRARCVLDRREEHLRLRLRERTAHRGDQPGDLHRGAPYAHE